MSTRFIQFTKAEEQKQWHALEDQLPPTSLCVLIRTPSYQTVAIYGEAGGWRLQTGELERNPVISWRFI